MEYQKSKLIVILLFISFFLPLIGYPQTEYIDTLIQKLKDKDSNVRRNASEAIADIGTPAVDALIKTLKDDNFHCRIGAAWALGKINDTHAVEPLIAALKDEKPVVQLMAAEALGKTKDVRAVEPLIAALNDKNRIRFFLKYQTLRKQDSKERMASTNVRSSAAWALGEIKDTRAIKPLIAALKDTDIYGGSVFAEALSKIGTPALETLISTIKDKDPEIRKRVARALTLYR
jgi:HEAT repeat protein